MPTSVNMQHLKTQQGELRRRYDTLTKRITALDTDIGRELDSERKLVLQERRAELAAERDQITDGISRIELQLDSGTGITGLLNQRDTRVLIVDDSQKNRARLAAILRALGCQSSEATTNAEALAQLARARPTFALVITDAFRRPENAGEAGYVGLGLVRTINRQHPDTPVVLISRDSPNLLWQQAPDLKVALLLSKEVSDVEITNALQQVLNGETLPNPWTAAAATSVQPTMVPAPPPQQSVRMPQPTVAPFAQMDMPRLPASDSSHDLQLLVTLASDGKTLSYTLNSPAGDYNFLQLGSVTLQVPPREVLQRTFDRLSTLAHLSPEKRTPAQTRQAVRELADIGSNLYDELLPDAFKEEYRTLREKYLGGNLWLTSNEPWIPWEVVRPVAYNRQGVPLYNDASLCESFCLARWVSGTAAPARLALQRAIVIRPPADLKATSVESDYFARLAGAMPGLVVDAPLETVNDTLEAFSAGQTQLYHFACHGNFDVTDPNESKLKLADGFLTPSQLTGDRKSSLLRVRPLVFVNACHAGERGFTLTRLGGWAERFIAAGASAFIGSLWEINDELAARFAVEFYNRLFGLVGCARLPLGQAFREARLVLKALDPANPTWLAYVLYGNPRAEFNI